VIVTVAALLQVATYTLPPVELPRYVSEEPEVVWYPISGSTLSDLRREMSLHGPRDDEGVHAGLTRTWTRWHFQFTGTPCYMQAVQVTVYDTITLPLWTPPPRPDSALVAEWGRFVTMLGRHEAGHRSIAIEDAGQIATRLASFPSRATCADMMAAANADGQAILASSRERQKQYDADTRHGLRRGTAFEDLDAPAQQSSWVVLSCISALLVLTTFIVWRRRSRTK
jgi:predicted secreted Zn-dependent protease